MDATILRLFACIQIITLPLSVYLFKFILFVFNTQRFVIFFEKIPTKISNRILPIQRFILYNNLYMYRIGELIWNANICS